MSLTCLTVSLSLAHWYPGSGVVLDCIYSLSLPLCLLRRNIFCFKSTIRFLFCISNGDIHVFHGDIIIVTGVSPSLFFHC